MDEVVLEGKTYVGSKIAAAQFGYAQDYIGQLCRKGFIDARRVSGQWYVLLDSVKAYKEKAELTKPEPPKYQPDPNVEAKLDVDGREYISAAAAAKVTTYNQDYIAQLARAGKIPSRQVGTRWYVESEALIRHKQEKDAMLRAVQAESVGLSKQQHVHVAHATPSKPMQALMTYQKDDKPLFPVMGEEVELKAYPEPVRTEPLIAGPTTKIGIRVLRPIEMTAKTESLPEARPVPVKIKSETSVAIPRKAIFTWLFPRLAFSIVIILAVGVGIYNRDAIYAAVAPTGSSQTASVGALDNVATVIENVLSPELVYVRR